MSGVSVRSATAHDAQAIADLSNIYIRNTAIHFGLEEMKADSFAEQIRKDAGRYPWLIAQIDGDFAGFAKAGVWRERAAYSRTAESAVYVHPSLHRCGAGMALYARLIDLMRSAEFHTIVAGITLPNDASVCLHERLGFRFVGRFTEVGRKFDAWHDVGWWQLML